MHEPADSQENHDPAVLQFNSKLGLALFVIYTLAFLLFVLLQAFLPGLMDVLVFADLNLATAYGLALILGALLLAIIYAMGCRLPREQP
ncbi:MAG TPA: DUF485 domain-containing protein [Gemmatales bacterium]|nr:DUF485 domain-containing protein [Gemmatales bacterium]